MFDDLFGNQGAQGVKNGLAPGIHLLGLGTRQVAKLLATNRVEGPKDHDLLVLAALNYRFESRTQGQGRLSGSCTTAHRDDANFLIEKHVDGQSLLGGSAVHSKYLAVTSNELYLLIGCDPAEGVAAL